RALGLLPAGATIGQAGLELEYQKQLGGHYGSQAILVNAQGVPVALGPTIPPRNGGTVVTSLDLNLQLLTTKLLQKAIAGGYPNSQPGDQGAAVVLDPQDGQVLAMASWPAYNDNIFGAPRNSAAIAALLSARAAPCLNMPPRPPSRRAPTSSWSSPRRMPPTARSRPGKFIPTGY
ncbi:penicillin-binding protein 2, partial [mine drainage metagenome]